MTTAQERWGRLRKEAPLLRERLRLLGVEGAEQDAVLEEALLRTLRVAPDDEQSIPLGVELFGVAVRVVLTRRNERSELADIAVSTTSAESKLSSRELAALGEVPFKQRAILVGVDLAGYTLEEVAITLNLDQAEVKRRLLDARAAFAKALRDRER